MHNGIIENYKELKEYLQNRGHSFLSDTDSEVVPHLIEDFLKDGRNFNEALIEALEMIKGAYAFAIIDSKNPDILYAVRLSSPLVIGVGNYENFLASDPSALVGKTKNVIYLKDGEIAEIKKDSINIINLEQQKTTADIVRLEWNLEQAQKGDYKHFMLKEIFEGLEIVLSALRGRLKSKENLVKLGGLEQVAEKLKKARNELQVYSDELRQSNDMKELLLDIITHDLKNPAGVIYGFTKLLLEQDSTDQMVQSINESSDVLLKVIDNATALANVALGESIEKQEINLSEMLKNVKTEFEPIANQANIAIEFQSPGDVFIKANPIISEVFKNYLSNAIKYAQEGKRIALGIEEKGKSVKVTIRDFGETIPEDSREAIFLRQARLDKEKRGRGLGLAIVKRIAEAHGGKVWVEPNSPQGNCFCFEISKNGLV